MILDGFDEAGVLERALERVLRGRGAYVGVGVGWVGARGVVY